MEPWSSIKPPKGMTSYTARLADPENAYNFYWARNADRKFVFRFLGHFPEDYFDDTPDMSGITTIVGSEDEREHITLILEDKEDARIFSYLCKSLLEATAIIPSGNDTAAAKIVLTNLRRWQRLLKARGSKLLSLNEQMGLFGELLVLEDVFLDNLDPGDAINCWNGPMGDEQDFGYGDSLVEVKTCRTTRDREIRISSIAQLDPVSGNIALVHQTVGVFQDEPPASLSLNGIVARISKRLDSASVEIRDLFFVRLLMAGYEQHPEYDKNHFVPVTRRIFAVEGGFPRLGSMDIRPGISKASYSILVEQCLPFEMDPGAAIARILKHRDNVTLSEVKADPETLIRLDESRSLEFKSSLKFCYRSKKPEKYIEEAILKTIAAFANTDGGILVIGVDDNNEVQGLENDFPFLKSPDLDGFGLHLSTMMVNAFGGTFAATRVKSQFIVIEEKDVCLVHIEKSDDLKFVEITNKSGQKSKKLYARIGNSTREIPTDEIPAYISNRH